MAILLGVLLWMNKVEEDKKSAELRALNKKLYQEEQEKQIALKQKEAEDSFYQKMADGFDVNVLVVGDSIAEGGQGENGWCTLLQNNLRKTYNNRVSFTNVSMGGNASYAGYVRTMALNDDVGYDLAIICYGQNDGAGEIRKDKSYRIHNLYIFGHSLDVTDKDILKMFICNDNVQTKIFYYRENEDDKRALGKLIKNLILMMGQDELIKRTGGVNKTIEFIPQTIE